MNLQLVAALTVFHVPAHEALTTPSGNAEADAPSFQVQALAKDPAVDTADWVHRKNGHHEAQVGWCIAKDAKSALEVQ